MSTNFEGYEEKPESFWDDCDRKFAHLEFKGWSQTGRKMEESSKGGFLSFLPFKGARVVDYGIGGGQLGVRLFSEMEISHYTGIDISNRQLDVARGNLENYVEKCDLFKTPVDFSKIKADIFLSLACLQHFPSNAYVAEFFENLRCARFPFVAIQIRLAQVPMSIPNNVTYSCWLTGKSVGDELPGYRLVHFSDVDDKFYHYLIFQLGADSVSVEEEYEEYIRNYWNSVYPEIIRLKKRKSYDKPNTKVLEKKLRKVLDSESRLRQKLEKIESSKRYRFACAIAKVWCSLKTGKMS